MIAKIFAELPQRIDTHGFRFRLTIKYGIKQLYPIFDNSESTLFVGYFLTDVLVNDKKKKKVFLEKGVWTCKRLAEKMRVHEFTDALLAIPLMYDDNDDELKATLECLGRTLVGRLNENYNHVKLIN
jgi:hypothetical protein